MYRVTQGCQVATAACGRFLTEISPKIDRKLSVKVLFMPQPLNMNVWQLNTQIVLDLAASVLFLHRLIHNWQNNLKMTAKLFFQGS